MSGGESGALKRVTNASWSRSAGSANAANNARVRFPSSGLGRGRHLKALAGEGATAVEMGEGDEENRVLGVDDVDRSCIRRGRIAMAADRAKKPHRA
jgi:hypothetical protein